METTEFVWVCNYDGVHWVTDAFLPLMHPQGRIANVSSGLTRLAPEPLRERMLKVGSVGEADTYMTELRVRALLRWKGSDLIEVQQAVANGTAASLGYPMSAYPCSKILLNALTRCAFFFTFSAFPPDSRYGRGYAADNKASKPGLLINYINPGHVKTDMVRQPLPLIVVAVSDVRAQGGDHAPGTVQMGADSPCWAAVDDIGEKSGVGFALRKEIPW